MVRLGTVVGPGAGDAAVVRVGKGSVGLALSVDANGRYCRLDPFEGARLAVAEAARNVCCAGGEPIGLTDCLNFGNPEKPEVMWQLVEAIRGIAEACTGLAIPVVSGNVSLYNETDGQSILPTPTVAVVGLVPDVARAVGAGFGGPGRTLALIGRLTGELGGSEYLESILGKLAGRPPRLDLGLEAAVQRCVRELVRAGLVESAHDCSEGGIAVALAECCLLARPAPVGARVRLASGARADALLFGEEPSRVLISFPAERLAEIERRAASLGAPLEVVGATGGGALEVEGLFELPVAQLEQAYRGALPALLERRRG
jgi:phosphoribosylformylglycinamidine synthase